MKKIISVFLFLGMIAAMCSFPTLATNVDTEISPYYSNAFYANVDLSISDAGYTEVSSRCYGYDGTTKIEATTYLEFQTGWTWTQISNGQPDHQWTGSSTSTYFSETYTYQLQMSGNFRATTSFKVTRNGTSEVIVVHSEEFYYSPY